MKTVSGMGRSPAITKLKSEAEHCGISDYFHYPTLPVQIQMLILDIQSILLNTE
jgi:hypothetical protein